MPHILHRTWYINTGNMPREKAQEHLKSWREQIKEGEVLPHGITAIDYFVPVTGSQPTNVDVVIIPTDTWNTGQQIYDTTVKPSAAPEAVMVKK